MEQAFFLAILLFSLLGRITSYAIDTASSCKAKELTDPFLEHKD